MGRTAFSTQERINERPRKDWQARIAKSEEGSSETQGSWRHILDIGNRLANWFATRGINQLTREADRLFWVNCSDPLLAEYILSLPLSGLPEIRAALSVRGAQQKRKRLADVIRAAIARDWRQLAPMQIEDATDLYLCSLGWAKPPRGRTLLAPVALRSASSYRC